jgi:hypothetical protein
MALFLAGLAFILMAGDWPVIGLFIGLCGLTWFVFSGDENETV